MLNTQQVPPSGGYEVSAPQRVTPYESIAGLLLQHIGRLIQRLTRRPARPSFLFTAIAFLFLNLLTFLVFALVYVNTRQPSTIDQIVIAAGAVSFAMSGLIVILSARMHTLTIETVDVRTVSRLLSETD